MREVFAPQPRVSGYRHRHEHPVVLRDRSHMVNYSPLDELFRWVGLGSSSCAIVYGKLQSFGWVISGGGGKAITEILSHQPQQRDIQRPCCNHRGVRDRTHRLTLYAPLLYFIQHWLHLHVIPTGYTYSLSFRTPAVLKKSVSRQY